MALLAVMFIFAIWIFVYGLAVWAFMVAWNFLADTIFPALPHVEFLHVAAIFIVAYMIGGFFKSVAGKND